MKILIHTFLLLSSVSFADSLDSHLAKMKAVIAKDGRALFCVAQIPTGTYVENTSLWPRSAACVGDIIQNEGTMRERSGCGAFYLNTYNLGVTGVGSEGRMKIADGKKCDADGFEDVVALNLQGYVDEKAGKNDLAVAWVLYDGTRANFMKTVIVYTKKSTIGGLMNKKTKYEEWFDSKRAALVAKETKPTKRKTASKNTDEEDSDE